MLRILVISLFVANLLLLGFQKDNPVVQPETTVTQSVVKDSTIPTIHLFSEMIEDQDLLAGNRRCFSLGPFSAIEDQDEIRTRLQEVSTIISERQTEALVEKGYWVFMPPYASLLEANEEVMSLQALGFKDISVVLGGDWKNAVSLGYFMRQENALRRKKDLEDRGYAPLVRVQRQSEPRYWLEYEQSPGSELITLDMQNRPNDFMPRVLPCPEQGLSEIADANSQDSVAELAQQQISEEVHDPDPGENAGSALSIESIPQEAVETVPASTGDVGSGEVVDAAEGNENEPVEGAGASVDQAVEALPDIPGEVGGGEEADVANGIENTPEIAVETLTDAANETVPVSTGEVEVLDAADANANEPVEGAGTLPDQAVETVPDTPGEVGSGEEAADVAEGIENTPQDAVETLTGAVVETVPVSTGEAGTGEVVDAAEANENELAEGVGVLLDQAVDTMPDTPAEVGSGEQADDVANGIENTPQDTVETMTDVAVETGPESTGEVGAGEETDAAEGIQNAPEESAEALLNKTVGTGPDWYGEPEAAEATDAVEGIENVPVEDTEDLLNPGIETELETTGETGTSEG
ncbi:MAG: hypothetical protein QNK19_05890 [Xanthomonadales bacterium]|nr:hypothetical protein [Xanthomonadales bacterium]